jgi:hypothetical protein
MHLVRRPKHIITLAVRLTSHHTTLRLNRHAIGTCGIGSTVLDRAGSVEGVLGEGASQGLLARDLLAADEAVYRNSNCAVNVGCVAVFRETHLGESFRNTKDGFKVTDLDD